MKLEKLYCVLNYDESGNEQIAAMTMEGLNMQAVSSKKHLMEQALDLFRHECPHKDFFLAEFERVK